ncbi:uncharacterized protein LOC6580320 isoform X1 [Drosophila mojavensis]|uniref:uncharacterized protein LOC6580320 isoform X1 n=1 Tax=Drosophila mojavensis TaxID=7230 RepID=UPI0013EEA368|nr:uncharacterized protein LOC6580320 isoform X1 [Drosophila mojavensis]XP_032585598.1 uncharacterized protein LOC6580320 isoform X1 [Drosophila mojavensis]
MNEETEIEGERPLSTQKAKVLLIEDPTEGVNLKKPEQDAIKMNYMNYLSLILVGNPSPMEVVNGEYPLEWVGMEVIRRENKSTLYQFICLSAQKTEPKNVDLDKFYQTMNASALMRDVRQVLKKERWISKYVVTGPLRGNVGDWAYNSEESYIMNAIYRAVRAERLKESEVIFPYLLYLHRQRVENNRRR